MPTYTITTTPTVIDDGTAYELEIRNSGSARALLTNPAEYVRHGQIMRVQPGGVPVSATSIAGTTLDVTVIGPPFTPGGGGVTDAAVANQIANGTQTKAALSASIAPAGNALSLFRAGLATRLTTPCRLAFVGSSTTEGRNATTAANRWVNRFVTAVQAAYPSGTGSETTVVASDSATWGTLSTAAGVHGYNAGDGGTTSADYLTSTEISRVAALNPVAVFHMVGSNDITADPQVPLATYKANVLAKITAIRAQQTSRQSVHVLIHSYPKINGSIVGPITWASYGQQLRDLAAENPSFIVFIDLSEEYKNLGIPGSPQDPFGLIDTDLVHQNNNGHALMADLILQKILPSRPTAVAAAPTPDTTSPTITAFAANPGNQQNTMTWSGTDNVAITRWVLKRGTTTLYDGTATTYTETGLTNGTAYAYTLVAYDAAGNVSATSNASATPTSGATGPTPPSGMTTLATDTFSGGDAATIAGRNTDQGLGGSTVKQWVGNSANELAISSGRLVRGAGSGAAWSVGFAVTAADLEAGFVVPVLPSSAGSIILDVRRVNLTAAATPDGYRLGLTTTGALNVSKRVNGTTTVIINAVTVAAGDRVAIRAVGSTISMVVNGTVVGSVTDTSIGAAGFVAFAATAASTGFQLDDFVVFSA